MKGLVGKTALAAAVVVGPIVGISAATADASPVYGGAQAYASPWWQHAQWTNLQIANAYGPSNLYNYVTAESLRGCVACTALAVNVQIDLVSYAPYPPNELDVANAYDRGVSNDQNLAAAAMFVVTSPGRLSLSWSGYSQLWNIEWQLRSLKLQGSSNDAVQGQINTLLGEVIPILENDVTSTASTPAATPAPTPAVSPAVAPVKALVAPAPSGIQVTSNIQINS